LGYVYVDLVVRGKSSRRIRALVDTGSAYIVLDPKTISEVGLFETPFEVELTLADKRRGTCSNAHVLGLDVFIIDV
jgi:predicted aspartyl protease